MRWAVLSTIAASTTWPAPDIRGRVQRGQEADDQVGGAGEVAEQVERRHRRVGRRGARAEGTGDGDVGDVVPRGAGRRAVLAPAGHPAVDEAPAGGPGSRRGRPRGARRHRVACPRGGGRTRATRSSTRRTSSGCLRSSATERLPRPSTSCSGGTTARAGPPGRSMRTTSAPRSASSMPANGAGPMPASSTTRRPVRGPVTGAAWAARRGRRPRSTPAGCDRRCAGRPGRSRGRRSAGSRPGARRGRR